MCNHLNHSMRKVIWYLFGYLLGVLAIIAVIWGLGVMVFAL